MTACMRLRESCLWCYARAGLAKGWPSGSGGPAGGVSGAAGRGGDAPGELGGVARVVQLDVVQALTAVVGPVEAELQEDAQVAVAAGADRGGAVVRVVIAVRVRDEVRVEPGPAPIRGLAVVE